MNQIIVIKVGLFPFKEFILEAYDAYQYMQCYHKYKSTLGFAY